MQKKFLAVCFLAGALGTVSVQAMQFKRRPANQPEFSWKAVGYNVLKYGVTYPTLINGGFQLTKLFTPKITAGIAAKFGALAKWKFVGSFGTAVVTKLAPYLLYGYGVPAVLVVGAGTLAYKKYVLKKEILKDLLPEFPTSRADSV
jgi:hypothetical protein